MSEEVHHDDELIKRGERVISVSFRRSRNGLVLTSRIHPTVEELIKSWGRGETVPVGEFDRHWVSLDGKPLMIWDLANDPGVVPFGLGSYRLNAPGSQKLLDSPHKNPNKDGAIVNLSFLRLVGSSGPTGASFELRGAFSLDFMKSLGAGIVQASKKLYIDHLLPIDLTVSVSTQETRL